MGVFILIYSEGYSTGYKELIGIYSSAEKAEAAKLNDIHNFKHLSRSERGYSIEEVETDKEINYMFDEW